MRTADGWPAVLGLAAMSGEVDFTASHLLSHTLYDFLAGELLDAATAETQAALMLLAVGSISDVEVARMVLGARADQMLKEAVARGLLTVTERRTIALHPLLRELLIRRLEESDAETRSALLSSCRKLVDGRRWDESLSVAEVAHDAPFVTDAIEAALDDLLGAGRTSSLQRWVAAARAAGAVGGLIDYAESEALLRCNDLDRALALATQAAGSLEGDLLARAHLVAGRSAHLIDRPDRTGKHAGLAAESAESAETREGALWLRLLEALDRLSPDLGERLEDFRAAARGSIKQSLMISAGELGLAQLEGGFEAAFDDARAVLDLARNGADPIAHTGVLSPYSSILVKAARYEEALNSAEELRSVAESYGVEFPIRYAQIYSASARIGLRRFAVAARTLSMLERDTQEEPSFYFRQNLPVQRARLYASVNDLQRALDALSLGSSDRATAGDRSEFIGWQALLTAATGDSRRAVELAGHIRCESRGKPALALSLVAEVVSSLNDERPDQALTNLEAAIETEIWDPVVIAVRAVPRLATFIAEQPPLRAWFQRLLAASRDTSLAASVGLQVPREAKEKTTLSPREAEVHELLAQGLTNEEIAKVLYISVSTTKVHVKHIFEKLGVRSRLEAARALRGDV
jgi:ATP/maltotriose-dependent transcriptional regulator MalT